MKKSKLLQSSKEMLSRSFNPTKCKTSLRLATSRLKLLKNKKEVQVKQMRKEIAQLLESGQEQTARMRVEHVIREEKMMAAYDLLEIYCELTIARLPVIESQKSCPIDLKEAIASVIFASLRCGDVPELLDVRKQFTAKYGKDFTTAAIELRPQSGVGRVLVEKLSATAPEVQTKTKILSAIAEEHNIKWDHESHEENNSIPSNDLPSGASTYGRSKPYDEQPYSEAADSQVRPSASKMNNVFPNIPQHDSRITVESEKVTPPPPPIVNTTNQPEARPQGDNRNHLFQGDGNSSSPSRHRWNMEFKDATSAAQAAAESAELASMAAKAAAELSMRDKIMRQDSTELDANVTKNERPEMHWNPKVSHEQFPKEPVKESSSAHTGSHEQIDTINHNNHETATRFEEDNRGDAKEYSQPAPLLNSGSSSIDDPRNCGPPAVDRFSEMNPLGEVPRGERSMKKQSFNHVADPANDSAQKAENHLEETIEKQHSVSYRSHSSISDDVNIFANSEDLKDEHDAGENPFVDFTERETSYQMSSHENAAVVYDNFDSDTDDHRFDLGSNHDRHHSGFNLPSSSQKSPEHPSLKQDSWSPRSNLTKPVDATPPLFFTRENSPPAFSDNSTSKVEAEVDNFAPVTYDDSDGPSSDIEDNMNIGRHYTEDSRGDLDIVNEREQSSASQFEDISRRSTGSSLRLKRIHRKQLSISSDDEMKPEGFDSSNRQSVGSPLRRTRIHGKQLSISSDDELKPQGFDSSSRRSVGSPLLQTRIHRKQLSISSDDELKLEGLDSSSRQSARSPLRQTGIHRKQLSISSDDELKPEDLDSSRTKAKKFVAGASRRLSLGKHSAAQPALGLKESQKELNNIVNESSSDNEEGISFGKLTGGLRNKGRKGLPFLKKPLDVSSSIKKETEKTTTETTTTSIVSLAAERPKRSTMLYNKKSTPDLHSESDNDSSKDEEILQRPSGCKLDTRIRKEVGTKPSLGASNLILHSDSSDLDEYPPKQSLARKNTLQTGISRRTRASPAASSGTNSYHKMHYRSDVSSTDADFVTKASYNSDTRKKSEPENSGKWENFEQSTSSKVATKPAKSIFWGPPEQHDPVKTTSTLIQESKTGLRSETYDTPTILGEKSRISNSSNTQRKGQSFNRNSSQLDSSEHPASTKMASKPIASSSLGTSEKPKATSTTTQKSKISQNSSKVEEPSKPPQKPEAAISSGDLKSETSNKNSSANKNESPKRASHVHPKLPDYDTLFQSLRMNRS